MEKMQEAAVKSSKKYFGGYEKMEKIYALSFDRIFIFY